MNEVTTKAVPPRVKFTTFFTVTHIDFMSKRKLGYFVSSALLIISIGLMLVKGVNLSIDFRGGIEVTLRPSANVGEQTIRDALTEAGYKDAEVKTITDAEGHADLLIRIKKSDFATADVANNIEKVVDQKIAPVTVEVRQTQSVGPKVGKELMISALYAILVTSLLIMIYLWWRFEWFFGVGATLAMIHDIIITAGFVVLLGYEFSMQIVAVLLTILGYSINDTIVVYDRIRENVKKHRGMSLTNIVNLSVNETLSRTLLTSITVMMSLVIILFVGGQVIHDFAVALLFGVVFGTYSSVFVASSLLIDSGVKDIGKAMAKKQKK
ncbi:MAG: protein translocase subunit SecF [bacterium]|nr:protein translocase subunit SecF [bacterium]